MKGGLRVISQQDAAWIAATVDAANRRRALGFLTFVSEQALVDAHGGKGEHNLLTALATLCVEPWSRDPDQLALVARANTMLDRYDPRGVLRKESMIFKRYALPREALTDAATTTNV